MACGPAQTVILWQIQAVALWRDIVSREVMWIVAIYQFFKMLGSVNARNFGATDEISQDIAIPLMTHEHLTKPVWFRIEK